MATDTRCERCGSAAVLIYIKIPTGDQECRFESPTNWPHVIECPTCGTREQQGKPEVRNHRPRPQRKV